MSGVLSKSDGNTWTAFDLYDMKREDNGLWSVDLDWVSDDLDKDMHVLGEKFGIDLSVAQMQGPSGYPLVRAKGSWSAVRDYLADYAQYSENKDDVASFAMLDEPAA